MKRFKRVREKSLVKFTWKIKVSGFMWINCSEREWISKLADEYLSMPIMSSWNSTANQSKAALKGPKWLHSDFMSDYFCHRFKQNPSSHSSLRKEVTRRMACTTPVMSPWHNSVWGQTQVYCWKALAYENYFCYRNYCMYAWVTEDMLIIKNGGSYFFSQLFPLLFLSCKFGFVWINHYFPV